MAIKWKSLRSGLLWTVFSPLALLMALISTVKSDIDYNVQIAVCGTWSAFGVISGVGRIVGASWAMRVQIILCWIAFAAFAVPGVVMVTYVVRDPDSYFLFPIPAMVVATGIPFLIYARRRQRELSEQRSTTVLQD
jgi:hypothetical protein